ncbi:MAG: hypothetical protein JW709_08660 [Sedimentisphaerales bacterium]|nr:hypothetical protein [Sedimentisphaerales bacterium]
MLEQPDALITWQIPLPPEQWADHPITCLRLPNHRKTYLTYEGPLSNNRGKVRIVCRGEYKLIVAASSHWQFDLLGDTLQHQINLEQPTEEPDPCAWMLTAKCLPA